MNTTMFPFEDVFRTNPDASLSPRREIHFNGQSMKPGVMIKPGELFGGVDISQHYGKSLEVEDHGNHLLILGFYP